jgi:hypothetical protein
MSLKLFIDTFKEVSEAHQLVVTFTTGEQSDIALTGSDNYPLVHLDQPFNIAVERGICANSVRFYVLDIEKNENLWNERLDSCLRIGQEIIEYLRINYPSTFQLNSTYNVTTFTEFSDDYTIGCLFEIDVNWGFKFCREDLNIIINL